ncbi:MAG: sugar phosphate isomerase/epimerase family protein [Phycisphaeraceae bacterium]
MIELGGCGFCFKGWDAGEALRGLRAMGLKRISLGMNGPDAQIHPDEAAARPAELGREVAKLAERADAKLVELFMCPLWVEPLGGVEPNDPRPAAREAMLERFKAVCEFAAVAGFEHIMGVPGVVQEELGAARSWDLSVDLLTRMVEAANNAGVVFTVEPHRGSIVDQPDELGQLLEAVPGLKLTLDYTHFVGAGIGEQTLMPFHGRAQHLHAKPARPGQFRTSVDENTIDYRAILADLVERGWSGTICMETFGNARNPESLRAHPAHDTLRLAWMLEAMLEELGAAASAQA